MKKLKIEVIWRDSEEAPSLFTGIVEFDIELGCLTMHDEKLRSTIIPLDCIKNVETSLEESKDDT